MSEKESKAVHVVAVDENGLEIPSFIPNTFRGFGPVGSASDPNERFDREVEALAQRPSAEVPGSSPSHKDGHIPSNRTSESKLFTAEEILAGPPKGARFGLRTLWVSLAVKSIAYRARVRDPRNPFKDGEHLSNEDVEKLREAMDECRRHIAILAGEWNVPAFSNTLLEIGKMLDRIVTAETYNWNLPAYLPNLVEGADHLEMISYQFRAMIQREKRRASVKKGTNNEAITEEKDKNGGGEQPAPTSPAVRNNNPEGQSAPGSPTAGEKKEIPAMDDDPRNWIKSKDAAKQESVDTGTLRKYRGKRLAQEISLDRMSGIDHDGRQWRRKGTTNSQPFYYVPTLRASKRK